MSYEIKPVLFLLFNRPDLSARVFEEIRRAKPARLYVAVDGPRDGHDEQHLVEDCQRLATDVDWDCEVRTLFREKNLGCGEAVSTAISWFFESEESGIILEDDCLPAPSFFPFVSELLDRYADEPRIMHIGGSNHQRGVKRTDADYYFSRYEHVWGWGSWQRAWQNYDYYIRSWREQRDTQWLEGLFGKRGETGQFWANILDQVKAGKIDTWDYQWRYTIWDHEGCSVIPEANLISNIGFDARATHTRDGASLDANRPLGRLDFPLDHPDIEVLCDEADHFHESCYLPRISRINPVRRLLVAIRNRLRKNT